MYKQWTYDYCRDIESEARTYSRTWCRIFSQSLVETITAPEIRDMIYLPLLSEAIDGGVLIKSMSNSSWSLPSSLPLSQCYACSGYNVLPHYLSSRYMGEEFLSEICQAWYKHVEHTVESPLEILPLLKFGPLQEYPLNPPHAFLRRLNINFNFYDQEPKDVYEFLATKQDFEAQVSCLEHCELIAHLKGFELTLLVDVIAAVTAEKYEEAMVEHVSRLKTKGIKLVIGCSHGSPSFNYDKPLSEWQEKIRTNSVFVIP